MARELMKGLAHKRVRAPAPADLVLFATADGDRGDAGVLLHVGGRREPGAIGSEGGEQAWREGGPRPGQRAEELRVGMDGEVLRNVRVQLRDTWGQRPERAVPPWRRARVNPSGSQ